MHFATASEMAKLDRLAVKAGLDIQQMMELAGWHLLQIARQTKVKRGASIVIICGKGNKGGDGLSAAHHLHNYGYKITVVLSSPQQKKNGKHLLGLLNKMGVKILLSPAHQISIKTAIANSDLIVDALVGYRLSGQLRSPVKELASLINRANKKVIAYDIPTGISASTGQIMDQAVNADVTLALALPKKAFKLAEVKKLSGKILVADIGIPKVLYNKISRQSRPDFLPNGLIKH